MEPRYFRVMLGGKSSQAQKGFEGGFMGTDYGILQDLSSFLKGDKKNFKEHLVPIYLQYHPRKKKINASGAAEQLWLASKDIQIGDRILSPNGDRQYVVGEVTSDYHYVSGDVLPHRRSVKWSSTTIDRNSMSPGLQSLTGIPKTAVEISNMKTEIE